MNKTCRNCGCPLSKTNIRQARAAAGLPADELQYFCPRFDSVTDTCPTYGKRDGTTAARWRTN